MDDSADTAAAESAGNDTVVGSPAASGDSGSNAAVAADSTAASADSASASGASDASPSAAASADVDAGTADNGQAAAAVPNATAAADSDDADAEGLDDLSTLKALIGEGQELALEVGTAVAHALMQAGHVLSALEAHVAAAVKHLVAPFVSSDAGEPGTAEGSPGE